MAHAYLKGPPVPPYSCTKVPFMTREEARNRIRRTGTHEPDRSLVESSYGVLEIYRCKRCGHWHLGHKQFHSNRTTR